MVLNQALLVAFVVPSSLGFVIVIKEKERKERT
jgi:hypothetical protein